MLSLGLGFRASRLKRDKLFKCIIIILACILSFLLRLIPTIKNPQEGGPIIQEIDPYFQLRATKYLKDHGFYAFLNWFDKQSWYPLGRDVGNTIYPGLMLTVIAFEYISKNVLFLPIPIEKLCIFLGPIFSVFTVLITYGLTKELSDNVGAGLLSAAFISMVPANIPRSSIGSFDNEAISIFAILLILYFWTKSLKSGQILYGVLASFAYFYLSLSWGMYKFILNVIALHVFVNMVMLNFFNRKLYVAYTTFYVMGTILSMQVPNLKFKVVTDVEHLPALGIFGLCQIYAFQKSVRRYLFHNDVTYKKIRNTCCGILLVVGIAVVLFSSSVKSNNFNLESRLSSLISISKTALESKNTVSSVAEHQPSSWSRFYADFQFLLIAFPIGIWWSFAKPSLYRTLLMVYGATSIYLAARMSRFMLICAPIMCISSGIGISYFLFLFTKELDITAIFDRKNRADRLRLEKIHLQKLEKKQGFEGHDAIHSNRREVASLGIICLTYFLLTFSKHSIWAVENLYSYPTITEKSVLHNNKYYDDLRECYSWIRSNTPEKSKILSWWDYGYHLSALANRVTIIDNNTWNFTHMGLVGYAFASDEEIAVKILRNQLDVDYVLVKFGGYTGLRGDDIDKFPWMMRIAQDTLHGNFIKTPISELDYMHQRKYFTIGKMAPKKLTESLLFKLSYHNYYQTKIPGLLEGAEQMGSTRNIGKGYDLNRREMLEGPHRYIRLKYFTEVYTTENWRYRIFKVKGLPNRRD